MNARVLLVALLCGVPAAAFGETHVSVGLTIGRPAPIIIARPPPVRVPEARTLPPTPDYVWVEGHYTWQNQQWVWVPAAWVQPPQPGAVWVVPRWDAATQSWTEGYWQVTQTQPNTPPPPVVVAAPAGPTVVITTPPPPPRREHRGYRPGRGYVWIDGYWALRHGHHVWVPGYWTRPPHGHGHWVAPRWEHRGGSYVFIEGFWR